MNNQCQVCKGSGNGLGYWEHKCHACGGTGQVLLDPAPQMVDYNKCMRCRGTGTQPTYTVDIGNEDGNERHVLVGPKGARCKGKLHNSLIHGLGICNGPFPPGEATKPTFSERERKIFWQGFEYGRSTTNDGSVKDESSTR